MATGNKASPDLIPEISRAPGTSPTPPTQWLQFLDHSTSHKPWKCLRRLSSWTWAGMVLQLLAWCCSYWDGQKDSQERRHGLGYSLPLNRGHPGWLSGPLLAGQSFPRALLKWGHRGGRPVIQFPTLWLTFGG